MKASSILLIVSFVIGISIISALVILNPPTNSLGTKIFFTDEKSRQQQYWDDIAKLYPDDYLIFEKKVITRSFEPEDSLIEINGLRSVYATDEPIPFEVLAIGNGDGCLSFSVTIRGEDENVPPVYSQGYVSICDISGKYVGIPLYFNINSENGQITNLEPGKYEIMAEYYQNRASNGYVKQEFTIEN